MPTRRRTCLGVRDGIVRDLWQPGAEDVSGAGRDTGDGGGRHAIIDGDDDLEAIAMASPTVVLGEGEATVANGAGFKALRAFGEIGPGFRPADQGLGDE
jgi:hypothetical protein